MLAVAAAATETIPRLPRWYQTLREPPAQPMWSCVVFRAPGAVRLETPTGCFEIREPALSACTFVKARKG